MFGAVCLREHREPTAGPFDRAGFVLSGAGLALVLYALSQGPTEGWRSPPVLLTGAAGVAAFVALVRVELGQSAPMLALRLFTDRMFRTANLVSLLSYASFTAVLFAMPLFLQDLRALTALESGLTTFPQAIGVMVFSQVAGRLYPAVGPRRLMVFGLTGAAITVAAFTQIDLTSSLWWIRGLMFARGGFMAFSFIPLQAATFATITSTDTGRARRSSARNGSSRPPSGSRPRPRCWCRPPSGISLGSAAPPGRRQWRRVSAPTTTCSRWRP